MDSVGFKNKIAERIEKKGEGMGLIKTHNLFISNSQNLIRMKKRRWLEADM